ncbi:peptidylprolyl isomerase [Lacinutrix neustonica]|uniref:Periplasmic chaperone PpiD n=1 Tax=Lacinutrix neustonica TaxID=2980107 RepID=A0A9E8MUR4_9FLAO|nr:peptidylprolyl isomerase [Lacinutrix neustonica]WAC01426.1 peptidylprolyl isomerase [Lacinutrix neustonica]
MSKSEIKDYITKNKTKYEVEASRNFQYVKFEELASIKDEDEIQDALIALVKGREVYNETTKETERAPGFANVSIEKAEEFVNANSDAEVKFQDKFVYASSFPKNIQDSILKLNVGDVYGPYRDGQTYKLTKLLAKRELADSIKSSHIIIPFAGTQTATPDLTRTKAEAEKMADSILTLVKNDKVKYAEVANEINTDGTKGEDGSIGWIRLTDYNPAAFDPDFANFLFFNETGAVDVVLTKFGFHIIRIDEKKNVDTAYKVATIERKIEPSIETEDAIFRDASNFEVSVGDKDFQEVAKAKNLKVNPVNTVKVLDENIPGAGAQRSLVRWTFEDGTKVGDIKRFKTTDGYIVVQLTKKNEAGLMNIEDASVTALPKIRKEKKAEMIKDRIKAKTLTDLAAAEKQTVKSALAINMKNPTVAGAGLEPIVVGTAFGLKEGQTSGLVTGNKGVYMVQLTKLTPASKLENYQSFSNQVSTQKSMAINTRLYNALKEAAEIEDNRANTVQ